MIHFKKIRWKNFLSTGNSFTEVQLDRTKSTLIIGDNGAGKSTILDALTFGLFGKPFRNINKTQLINSVNGGGPNKKQPASFDRSITICHAFSHIACTIGRVEAYFSP